MKKKQFDFLQKLKLQENFIDKVVSYVSPEAGAKRLKARAVLALAGSYNGASKSRRQTKEWNTHEGDADSDILQDLPTLRARSRDLARNNPLAGGALNTKVTNVVGPGLKLRCSVQWDFLGLTEEQADKWERNTEREFRLWAESPDCHVSRTLDFYSLQELAFRSVLENGDTFVLLPFKATKGMPYRTKIQLIEADRVCNEGNSADTLTQAGGVVREEDGTPIAYQIMTTHPGSHVSHERKWETVSAFGAATGRRNVLHLYQTLRIGQTRGVPDLAPVIETLKQLGTYTEAEIMAAVISGMFTIFIKSNSPEGLAPMEPLAETNAQSDDDDYKLGPGAVLQLATNEDITSANPGRPNAQFDPFVKAILEQIGVGLELPFEVLTKHFTASYSAARAALIEAWKFFSARREWLAKALCQPVYETWLEEAVALGRIYAPGFLDGDPAIRKAYCGARWIGPARGQIDEKKEAEAAELRVNAGFSTLEQETAEMNGGDWENNHRQRAKEAKMRKADGLEIEKPPAVQNNSNQSNEETD